MDGAVSGRLVGSEIHGFRTLDDLDVVTMWEEARTRWLRPNEIHAVLCNYKYFSVNVKPVNLPKSGTIVLFDRKMLRNFRKDGHNWKKKNDGKTVKEAHEHLKVGNEERIHVYYAHGQDNPTFVRRCYWLLDKKLEHIVLVHYRETQEVSPATSGNSNSSSTSDPSTPWFLTEETNCGVDNAYYAQEKESLESGDRLTLKNHELRLHEINTLEWDELLAKNDVNSVLPKAGFVQQGQIAVNGPTSDERQLPAYNLSPEKSSFSNSLVPTVQSDILHFDPPVITSASMDVLVNDGLQSQDSFGRWMDYIIDDSPGSMSDPTLESPISSVHDSVPSPVISDLLSSVPEQVFTIKDVSPAWAYSNEKTKVFHELFLSYLNAGLSFLLFLLVDLFFLFVFKFDIVPNVHDPVVKTEELFKWEKFQLQTRLSYLLFSTNKSLDILSSKVSPSSLKEARKFAQKTSHLSNSWAYLMKSIQDNQTSFPEAKDMLFELTLKNRLKEWLIERILEGCKATEYDAHGQGVIHLCSILGYTWAIHLFSWSGISLNFRDKHGWTALHWAAFYGREKMVAVLLSAGAKPNLVTDPTSKNPGGSTAADLASKNGYDGLAAFLSEKALVAQFKDMSLAGNVSGSLQSSTTDKTNTENLTEEELYLKDTLAAYRTVAEAASRIQVAFREHSLKVRTKAVEASSPEDDARNIIAAMKIQHAFRNYETRKRLAAAARIQHRFRTWKMRREFLTMRRQAIKIQAAFRGFQVRRQYRKILWSVGVVEKAILRWRLKRRGFRGLSVDKCEDVADQGQESDVEDFYKTSQKQAEERVERSVVSVQAMFRSKKAQEEYRRMKLAHDQAKLEYECLEDYDTDLLKPQEFR
ncbi:calmodulin-binding transcription activator 5 [Carica papaya]|uniref:calmodulin-binding transcription activator 5 n=1 Tax=Carica papaya TaxID=3649 RepID=UPI000B8CA6DF|nr:calmodulin-binding transcription activator 5 [Carica papaya]